MSHTEVVVYTSRECDQCKVLISKLNEWEIDFEERNISDNREYFKELKSRKVYGTPATFVDGEKILGFQERKLKRVLGIPYESQFFHDAINFS
ncbi:glutaredoxin family protein [Halobacillus litoralis]|uniref:glutaredoxin family protein n=1 Tax=Halobacillus litoralis TaxID=45668 RepID=UPI001CD23524|nr:glutaredoxin family protein [Halobacillus litoralis]MCA0972805.1 glutaredoxin family protein [Halobacillus litoralis]